MVTEFFGKIYKNKKTGQVVITVPKVVSPFLEDGVRYLVRVEKTNNG